MAVGLGDVVGDRERMSDLESLMWTLESDPFLSSNFANITFFDRSPDHERFSRRLQRASRKVPRLRRRVIDGPGPLPPTWEDDPDFDVDHHLRRVTLPPGATDDDALALATELALAPFDQQRPLWEFTVIDGLPHGRSAMVQKLHHTITDGEGGIRMSVEFIDVERHPPEPPPLDDPVPTDGDGDGDGDDGHGPAWLAGWLRQRADGALRQAGERVGAAAGAVRHPGQLATTLVGLPGESAAMAQSMARQLAVLGSFRSPVWTGRSLHRSLHVFDVALDEVQATAHHLGGSVNDVFVAAAAGGAGSYHRARGHHIDELRMSMPVSTRTGRTAGGNAFAPTRVLVPVGPDPRQRFAQVHERLTVTKRERAMGAMTSLSGAARLLPRPVLVRLARQQVTTVDFTTSNLKAAPFDLYIGGALMEHNFPIGPLMGTAWNLTTMSYRGRLDMGLHVDAGAVDDPAELAEHVEMSFRELLSLAG